MDNAPAQCLDLAERRGHVSDREVGQRDRVAGTGAALVDADGGIPGVCLPAAALGLAALAQLDAEQIRPEPPRAVWIIGGELDQGERPVHPQDHNADRRRPSAAVPARLAGRRRPSRRRTAPSQRRQQRRPGDRAWPHTPQGVTAAWWPPCCKFGSAGAGAESALSRLQFARSRLAPGASGSLDPAADPDLGPSAEMRACGEERDQGPSCVRDLPSWQRGCAVRYGRREHDVVALHPMQTSGWSDARDCIADGAAASWTRPRTAGRRPEQHSARRRPGVSLGRDCERVATASPVRWSVSAPRLEPHSRPNSMSPPGHRPPKPPADRITSP
jgi:hypothetical protein